VRWMIAVRNALCMVVIGFVIGVLESLPRVGLCRRLSASGL
jgi:hypothetical protein